jgi:hypothetical protein
LYEYYHPVTNQDPSSFVYISDSVEEAMTKERIWNVMLLSLSASELIFSRNIPESENLLMCGLFATFSIEILRKTCK